MLYDEGGHMGVPLCDVTLFVLSSVLTGDSLQSNPAWGQANFTEQKTQR